MKNWPFLLSVVALSGWALALSGCSHSSPQPTVTKESFGYPGMKLGPGYYAEMKKVHASQAATPPAKPTQ